MSIFHPIYDAGCLLLGPTLCCSTLCTSGFVDDVMISHTGLYGVFLHGSRTASQTSKDGSSVA